MGERTVEENKQIVEDHIDGLEADLREARKDNRRLLEANARLQQSNRSLSRCLQRYEIASMEIRASLYCL